jgi:hypothetical protein
MSTCLFRETINLFEIIEAIKNLEYVDKVSSAEEVDDKRSKVDSMIFSSLV